MAISRSQGRSSAVRNLAVLLCVMVLSEYVAAVTINVGGNNGWAQGVDYKTWAAGQRVKPNDTLFFKYNNQMHSVLQVSKADYDACKVTSPMSRHTSGKDSIKVPNAGTFYFICGVANGLHCRNGLKVAVSVKV